MTSGEYDYLEKLTKGLSQYISWNEHEALKSNSNNFHVVMGEIQRKSAFLYHDFDPDIQYTTDGDIPGFEFEKVYQNEEEEDENEEEEDENEEEEDEYEEEEDEYEEEEQYEYEDDSPEIDSEHDEEDIEEETMIDWNRNTPMGKFHNMSVDKFFQQEVEEIQSRTAMNEDGNEGQEIQSEAMNEDGENDDQ